MAANANAIYRNPFLLTITFFTFFFVYVLGSNEAGFLLTFKSSIDDPRNHLSGWSNTSALHPCNWTGVSCISTPGSAFVSSLNLQNLNLSGDISSSVCGLTHLAHLNLADNLFNQPIPLHLSECTSLESLNLSNNLIWGTIPDQISQFGLLKVLDLSKNHIEGKIPEGIGSLVNLQVLNLGNNLISGTIVPFIFGNLTQLLVIDLSQNPYLMSEIPDDIGKLDKLEQLLLQSSNFYGGVPGSFVGLNSLKVLDLSQNNLTGVFNQTFGFSLKNLVSFDVSQNKFFGSFPNGICNGKVLINLSVHSNSFNGSIPSSVNECLILERFQVQNNGFSGEFPSSLWSLPKIKLVRTENNKFTGEIPSSISMASQLEQVQIDNNSFTGQIPTGLGLIKTLYRFSASLNDLQGELPSNFCDSPVMSIINLSHNSLSGELPELKKCKKLVSLSLSDNNFTGSIPLSLSDLPVLTYLDLSDNHLTGSIPQELQNLKLALFNVSFNQLSGSVPSSLISGLPASFLQGNPGLCGPGLTNPCTTSASDHASRRRALGVSTFACVLITIAFLCGVTLVVAAVFAFRRYYKTEARSGSLGSIYFYPLRVSEHDLVMGMDEKSGVGNGGPFGRVYTISLPSGETVCLKKLVNFGTQSSKTLKVEAKLLAKMRHKNMVKILGLCYCDESIVLIYECLCNGSLGDLIVKPGFQMEWCVRLNIAIGVAQGLAYLHKDSVTCLIHRDLKSNNILLDSDFEPKITDFGLDRIVGEDGFQSIMASESADSCYIAPEYSYCKKPTEKMDVYSYGVVLLELLTGRQAEQVETSSSEPLDVVKWVRRKINITDGATQILDHKIPSSYHREMLIALDIALRCTSVGPEKRPSMVEVVGELVSLRLENDRLPCSELPMNVG